MRKAIIGVVAAAIAIAPAPLLAASGEEAHAYPLCDNYGNNKVYCDQVCAQHYRPVCDQGPSAPVQTPRPVQTPQAPPTHAPPPTYAPPSTMPVQTPQAPPTHAAPPTYAPPSTMPVQTPKINPPSTGGPRNAALVKPPKVMDAPQQAVAAAKAAPAARVNPATPPKPPTAVDFHQQVQSVISAHSGNVDVVKAGDQALVRPRHWDWVDYDADHRPTLYNPLTEAMTFRYFYDGAYREVYVAAGGRVVLDVATVSMFPFTAVGDSYLASGSFYGGAPPEVYDDVSAYVPADDQTVQLGQVTVLGHDDSQPAGSQDTFMLDDNTLAWGQANDPSHGAQITVTKTQSLPGVGPTDNGSFLVALTAQQQPSHDWWPWALGGGVLAIAVGLVAWVVIGRKRSADLTAGV